MDLCLLTGAVLEVRKWKISDMDILVGASDKGFLSALLRVFKGCTLGVVSPGIYGPDFNWDTVYEGDLFDSLWQWRAASVGEEYAFSMTCPNGNCRNAIQITYPVSEVARKPVSDFVMEKLKAGVNRIEVPLSIGAVTFLIPTAAEMRAITNASTKRASSVQQKGRGSVEATGDGETGKLMTALRQKVMSVRLDDGTVIEGGKLNSFLDLDLDVAWELFDALEEVSFGIDTAIQVTCGACGAAFDGEIPMQKGFFLKTGGRRKV